MRRPRLEGSQLAVVVARHPDQADAEAIGVEIRIREVVERIGSGEVEPEPELVDRILVEGMDPLRRQVVDIVRVDPRPLGVDVVQRPLTRSKLVTAEDAVLIAEMVIDPAVVLVEVDRPHDVLAAGEIERVLLLEAGRRKKLAHGGLRARMEPGSRNHVVHERLAGVDVVEDDGVTKPPAERGVGIAKRE